MIEFNNVTKLYKFKDADGVYRNNYILKDYTYTLPEGLIYGFYGPNGAGKSTVLRLISSTILPDCGKVNVNGLIVPFLELGVAFHDELTGIENIYLNGVLLGISLGKLKQMKQEIIKFANLDNSAGMPIKYYSTGMKARLAYSIARYADGSIYIFDEILAVGDNDFQSKCWENFEQLKKAKKTIIIASHDLAMLEQHCDQILFFSKENNPLIKG